jgi:hypothetical protein
MNRFGMTIANLRADLAEARLELDRVRGERDRLALDLYGVLSELADGGPTEAVRQVASLLLGGEMPDGRRSIGRALAEHDRRFGAPPEPPL